MSLEVIGLVSVACLYGIISGFNDGGNLLASFTAARVLRPGTALLLLLVVPLGPLLLGTAVAQTVGVNVINLPAQGAAGFVLIVLCSIAVVLLSWRLSVPTSMTLALVGAMVGWALAGGKNSAVRWSGLDRVVVGMPVSVLAGGIVAFLVYSYFREYLGGMAHGRALRLARFQILTAALQAFAYGANDMEKTIGLVAVARAIPTPLHRVEFQDALPLVASFLSFALGTLVGGWRVARHVAFGVVRVRPMQALTEQLAAGSIVALLAAVGAPVSSTQTIDGALVGVGVSFRASAVRWGVVRGLLGSWIVTLPLALALAMAIHAVTRLLGWNP